MTVAKLPVGSSDYYELFPSAEHHSGDVWTNLPTHGVLGVPRLPSLVITPACDLMNRKVETLTYLPIVAVGSYLASRSNLSEILKATNGQLKAAGIEVELTRGESGTELLPRLEDVTSLKTLVAERRGGRLGARQDAAAARAEDGLVVIADLLTGGDGLSVVPRLKALFGERDFSQMARRMVTNALRGDLHFLPGDEQAEAWSVVSQPSVVHFRYPLSIPIDILDLAQTVSEAAWATEVMRLEALYPCVGALAATRPVKSLRIKPRFMSDLLTRFVALYGRLGSPDFSEGTIDRYVSQIGVPE